MYFECFTRYIEPSSMHHYKWLQNKCLQQVESYCSLFLLCKRTPPRFVSRQQYYCNSKPIDLKKADGLGRIIIVIIIYVLMYFSLLILIAKKKSMLAISYTD